MPQVPIPRVRRVTGGGNGGYTAGGPAFQDPGIGAKLAEQAGRDMTRAGAALLGIGMKMREEEDLADAKSKLNQQNEFSNSVVQGYTALQGVNAGPDADKKSRALAAVEQIAARQQELGKGMSERARTLFFQKAEQNLVGIKAQLYGHEAKQRRIHTLGETRTAIDANSDRAIAQYGIARPPKMLVAAGEAASGAGVTEPDKETRPFWRVSLADAVGDAKEYAADIGWGVDSEQGKALVLATKTKVYAGIANNLLISGDADEAKEFLASVPKEQMQAQVRKDLNVKIERSISATISIDTATKVFQGTQEKQDKPKRQKTVREKVDSSGVFTQGDVMTWEELLPVIPEEDRTIDEEHALSLRPGSRVDPLSGLAQQKMVDEIMNSKLKPEQKADAVRHLRTMVSNQVELRSQRIEELTANVSAAMSTMPPGTLFDSPEFKRSFPNLYDEAVNTYSVDAMRSMVSIAHGEAMNTLKHQQFLEIQNNGKLGQMSPSQFAAMFRPYVPPKLYETMSGAYQTARGASEIKGPEFWSIAANIAGSKFTGTDTKGRPTADPDKPEEVRLHGLLLEELSRLDRTNDPVLQDEKLLRSHLEGVIHGERNVREKKEGWWWWEGNSMVPANESPTLLRRRLEESRDEEERAKLKKRISNLAYSYVINGKPYWVRATSIEEGVPGRLTQIVRDDGSIEYVDPNIISAAVDRRRLDRLVEAGRLTGEQATQMFSELQVPDKTKGAQDDGEAKRRAERRATLDRLFPNRNRTGEVDEVTSPWRLRNWMGDEGATAKRLAFEKRMLELGAKPIPIAEQIQLWQAARSK